MVVSRPPRRFGPSMMTMLFPAAISALPPYSTAPTPIPRTRSVGWCTSLGRNPPGTRSPTSPPPAAPLRRGRATPHGKGAHFRQRPYRRGRPAPDQPCSTAPGATPGNAAVGVSSVRYGAGAVSGAVCDFQAAMSATETITVSGSAPNSASIAAVVGPYSAARMASTKTGFSVAARFQPCTE